MKLFDYIADNTLNEEKLNNIKIIGITGTYGKTTTASILHSFFLANNIKASLFSTSVIYINNELVKQDTRYSTFSNKEQLIQFIIESYNKDCKYIIIELTAEAAWQDFWEDLPFEVIAITNLDASYSQHFDSRENYIAAKTHYFNLNDVKHKVLNNFGEPADEIFDGVSDKTIPLKDIDGMPTLINNIKDKTNSYYFGLKNDSSLKLEHFWLTRDTLKVYFKINKYSDLIYTNLIGKLNVENIACFLAIIDNLNLLDFENLNILDFLQTVVIDGRTELFKLENRFVLIDPMYGELCNLKSILDLIPKEKMVVCFSMGCLDSIPDFNKQYLQGIKGLVITRTLRYTEDLETEYIEQIYNSYLGKVNNLFIEKNRYLALQKTFELSNEGDYIILLGKGTEKYITPFGNIIEKEAIKKVVYEKLPIKDYEVRFYKNNITKDPYIVYLDGRTQEEVINKALESNPEFEDLDMNHIECIEL